MKLYNIIYMISIIFVLQGCNGSEGESGVLTTDDDNQEKVDNQAPYANAGEDKSAIINSTLEIEGSAYDRDGEIVSYEWSEGSTLLARSASFEYKASSVGEHTLTLTVEDDDGATASDTLKITVTQSSTEESTLSTKSIYHRLIWDSDPSSSAVIGFSPDSEMQDIEVAYGYSTDESSWSKVGVSDAQEFDGLTSYFVRLKNLKADSAIYYRVCDSTGCSQAYWFKTAPKDSSDPFVFIAGGDTRSGLDTRRDANRLIAKIRPLFIMHGGDFTNSNNRSEMEVLLSDFQLMYSDDTIDGVAYKRIYPMVSTMGNHEGGNYATLCEVFGFDYNQNGKCDSYDDTYGAFNVGPLLRVYSLNSEYRKLSSSMQDEQNEWFHKDISGSSASAAAWRVGQYHKPIYPHYSGKDDNEELFDWWADDFYKYAMNLLVESDSHMCKITKVIKPNSDGTRGFETATGGSLFVGEGSWGADTRSADDAKSWTQDLASINQLKIITLYSDKMEIRTAMFDGDASTLSRDDRLKSSTELPTGINWWSVDGIGETLVLTKDSEGKSVLDTSSSAPVVAESPTLTKSAAVESSEVTDDKELTLSVSEDTFIAKAEQDMPHNGSYENIVVTSGDDHYAKTYGLLKFDLSSLPKGALITSARLVLNIAEPSNGLYTIYTGAKLWRQKDATWNSLGGRVVVETKVAEFEALSSTESEIELNANGVDALNAWFNGNSNTGFVIASKSNERMRLYDMESKQGAKLLLRYRVQK